LTAEIEDHRLHIAVPSGIESLDRESWCIPEPRRAQEEEDRSHASKYLPTIVPSGVPGVPFVANRSRAAEISNQRNTRATAFEHPNPSLTEKK